MINNYQDALLKHQGQHTNPGLTENLWNVHQSISSQILGFAN